MEYTCKTCGATHTRRSSLECTACLAARADAYRARMAALTPEQLAAAKRRAARSERICSEGCSDDYTPGLPGSDSLARRDPEAI